MHQPLAELGFLAFRQRKMPVQHIQNRRFERFIIRSVPSAGAASVLLVPAAGKIGAAPLSSRADRAHCPSAVRAECDACKHIDEAAGARNAPYTALLLHLLENRLRNECLVAMRYDKLLLRCCPTDFSRFEGRFSCFSLNERAEVHLVLQDTPHRSGRPFAARCAAAIDRGRRFSLSIQPRRKHRRSCASGRPFKQLTHHCCCRFVRHKPAALLRVAAVAVRCIMTDEAAVLHFRL